MVMVSGYASALYSERLEEWEATSFDAQTRAGTPAREWVWMNYPPPTELHDYSFLGDTFRERERIKRKKARWVRKLASMPLLERQALSAALAEVK